MKEQCWKMILNFLPQCLPKHVTYQMQKPSSSVFYEVNLRTLQLSNLWTSRDRWKWQNFPSASPFLCLCFLLSLGEWLSSTVCSPPWCSVAPWAQSDIPNNWKCDLKQAVALLSCLCHGCCHSSESERAQFWLKKKLLIELFSDYVYKVIWNINEFHVLTCFLSLKIIHNVNTIIPKSLFWRIPVI